MIISAKWVTTPHYTAPLLSPAPLSRAPEIPHHKTTPLAAELNTQNMHCTRLRPIHTQFLERQLPSQEEELELDLAEAVGWKNAPMKACFMRLAGLTSGLLNAQWYLEPSDPNKTRPLGTPGLWVEKTPAGVLIGVGGAFLQYIGRIFATAGLTAPWPCRCIVFC